MRRRFAVLFLLCLFSLRCACAEVFLTLPAENWYQRPLLRLTAFSAAQSDCLFVECGGEAMMVDGGTAAYGDALIAAMEAQGISSFKYLLNTHFHEDHISGLITLMQAGFHAGEYLHPYAPNAIYTSPYQKEAIRTAEAQGIPARQVFHGDTLLLGEAVITLWRHDGGLSTNGRSVAARVQMGSAVLLLGADLIGDTQSWLAEELPPEALRADVLKAPHHGVSVMAEDFLQAVSPEILLMTNNRERSAEGGEQAAEWGIPTVYTEEGRVVMETDGTDWYVYQMEGF